MVDTTCFSEKKLGTPRDLMVDYRVFTHKNIANLQNLLGGLAHEFYDFPYIGNFIIPTDEVIFFRGVG
jgi:hypothetical protein